MARRIDVSYSDFYCTCCGNRTLTLPRKKNRIKEAGHLKKLYCIYCREEKNAVEIRPFGKYNIEDFRIEYENKNFDEAGNRIDSNYKTFIHNRRKDN